MKKIAFVFIYILLNNGNVFSQNVGIGNTSPTEKLDVTGNINVTGTIKANGIDGSANQVLMKNGSGVLAWGDMCEYKNAVTFTTLGAGTWTVPAGITKIRVELWGGGGGSTGNGSGAGGGYVTGVFIVAVAGSVSYTVGTGGAAPGNSGTASSASYASFSGIAFGGAGDNSAATFNVAAGGSFTGSVAAGFYGAVGEAGAQNRFEGYQLNSTTYRESQTGGKGGDGGNTVNTGGKGMYILRDGVTSNVIYGFFGGHGSMPGGGGGSGGIWGGQLKNGGQGMVIIHY